MAPSLRAQRLSRGISQASLARIVGVSRQTLIAVESGAQSPGVRLALGLARALGATVESLFDDPEEARIPELEALRGRGALEVDDRVWVGEVHAVRVAHAVGPAAARASGVVVSSSRARVTVALGGASSKTIFVAGCAQALGLLSAWASPSGLDVAWVHANSDEARDLLRRRRVHAAVVHHEAGASPSVARRARTPRRVGGAGHVAASRSTERIRLGAWDAGLVVRRRGLAPASLTEALAAPSRLALRERGSGAARLFERLRRRAHLARPVGFRSVTSHDEAAELVLRGDVDAAFANRPAARTRGLGFVPLAREDVDLLVDHASADADALRELVALLRRAAFARDVAATGHDTIDFGTTRGRCLEDG
ncbi:MAG: helix-turn-helix domain-containing protein [Labilithrix sp.]|nr:helix-turn-helix domain-containing protein [Labilithrix sp.]